LSSSSSSNSIFATTPSSSCNTNATSLQLSSSLAHVPSRPAAATTLTTLTTTTTTTNKDDPIVLGDDDDDDDKEKIDEDDAEQSDDEDDNNEDDEDACSEVGDDFHCTQIMDDVIDDIDDDINDDDDDDMDNAPLSRLLAQSKQQPQQQHSPFCSPSSSSSPRTKPLNLVDIGSHRTTSPKTTTNNIKSQDAAASSSSLQEASVGQKQQYPPNDPENNNNNNNNSNNSNIVDLLNDDDDNDNEDNSDPQTDAANSGRPFQQQQQQQHQQPISSPEDEMTITLQSTSNNNNDNNSNSNSNRDFAACSVCGVSLTHISTWKGRLNHLKRCSKQHGVSARDVAYNDDHEEFDVMAAPSSASNTNNSDTPKTAAAAASEASLKPWHGNNAQVDLQKQQQQSSGSSSSTKKQPGTDALSMLMAGARRAAKQAKLAGSIKAANAAAAVAAAARGGGGRRSSWWGGGGGGRGSGSGGGDGTFGQKNYACPAYKKIPGTNFVVDGFQYASSLSTAAGGKTALLPTYFLTHFHSDHYGGITRTWNTGIIYCSQPTANLVHDQLGVERHYLHPLPFDVPTEIATMTTRGVHKSVTVTLLNANHCPGAAMMLFEIPLSASSSSSSSNSNNNSKKRRILHVGDFRWNRSVMLGTTSSSNINNNNPLVTLATAVATGNEHARLDELFLDTTYCDAKYTLPTQAAAIAATVEYAVEQVQLAKMHRQRILLLFGTYTIGKERIYLAVAEKLGMKVYVDKRRFKILSAVMNEWLPEKLSSLLTTNPAETILWTAPLGHISMKKLPEYLQVKIGTFAREYSKVIGFRPTGWSMSTGGSRNEKQTKPSAAAHRGSSSIIKPQTRGKVTTVGVPYSEHSAFNELVDCIDCLRPRKIVPTVNVSKSEQQVDLLLTHLQRKDRTREQT
jgi:DNA cross-link repair 1A protein